MEELIKRQDAIDVVAKAYRYETDRLTALQELPIAEVGTAELLKAMADRLDEYEGLEEQGRLMKLPCKAGQKVFLLRKDIKSVIDGEITSIRIGEFASGMKIFIVDDNRYTDVSFDKIGDIVFFTREEAEAALEKLGKG